MPFTAQGVVGTVGRMDSEAPEPSFNKGGAVRGRSPRACTGCGAGKLVLVLMFECLGEFSLFGFLWLLILSFTCDLEGTISYIAGLHGRVNV